MKPQNITDAEYTAVADQIADLFCEVYEELHPGNGGEAEEIVTEVFENAGIRITRKDSA